MRSLLKYGLLSLSFWFIVLVACKEKPEYAIRVRRFWPNDTIKLDTKTSLKKLVKRLDKPWSFIETGDGLLIGYTDDMYNIANHKDKAIKPLLKLINTTDSIRTKKAALYTLYLIGIKKEGNGRGFVFEDTLARKAILSVINDTQINREAVLLLKRYSWGYDIPYFMNYLTKTENNYSFVLSALHKYLLDLNIKGRPLFEDLTEKIYNTELTVKADNPNKFNTIADLIALKRTLGDRMEIDDQILNSEEWSEGLKSSNNASGKEWTEYNRLYDNVQKIRLRVCEIESFGLNASIDLGGRDDDRFYYSFHDNKLYIYTESKARLILIDWWNSLSQERKDQIAHLHN